MKSTILLSSLFCAFYTHSVLAESTTVKLESEDAKVNYSVGYQVGGDFRRQNMKMDEAAFIQGIRDAISEAEPQMSTEDMQSTLVALKRRIVQEQQQKAAEQAKINIEKGNAYLAENGKKDGVTTLPSGLQYRVIKEGKGASPAETDTVSVHYTGTLIDDTVFDSSRDRGKPTQFPVNRVIKGWTEALMLMKEGSQWELVIPSELAYGAAGAGGKIPPNSVLKFDVELLSIVKAEENKKQ